MNAKLILLFLTVLIFFSCEKEKEFSSKNPEVLIKDPENYSLINQPALIKETKNYIILQNHQGNHIIFKDKDMNKTKILESQSFLMSLTPDYVFTPLNHVYDGTAFSTCDFPIPENGQLYWRIHFQGGQIGFSFYNNGHFSHSAFDQQTHYFYNTDKSYMQNAKEHFDCWCDNDPVETVKKLN